jgi:hypothetical protein
MQGQLMHFTKMHHFGLMRAERMALTRIYKMVSYIPLYANIEFTRNPFSHRRVFGHQMITLFGICKFVEIQLVDLWISWVVEVRW